MEDDEFLAEGDINFSEERKKWDQKVSDPETRKLLEEDSRYFLHQSMSSPCLDVLKSCKGSGMTTLSEKHLLDFHGNNVHQLGYGNDFIIQQITEQMNRLSFSPRRYTNQPAVELAKRYNRKTPCVKSGKCEDCNSPESICAITTIHRKKPYGINIVVMLINEDLGM